MKIKYSSTFDLSEKHSLNLSDHVQPIGKDPSVEVNLIGSIKATV